MFTLKPPDRVWAADQPSRVTTTTITVGTDPALEVVTYQPDYVTDRSCFLLHGASHSAACWKLWGPALAQAGISVHAFSLRGHGGSTMPAGATDARRATSSEYISDIHTVMTAFHRDTARTVLVGHSMGGILAQFYARHHPVDGLVILSSVVPQRAVTSMNELARRLGWGTYVSALTKNTMSLFDTPEKIRKVLLEPDADEDTVQFVLNALRPESEIALTPLFGALSRRVLPLPRLRTKRVLVLAGTDDGCFAQRAIRASARRLGRRYDTTLTLIPDGPHDLMLARDPARSQGVQALAQFCLEGSDDAD